MFRRLAGSCLVWGLIACCHKDDVRPATTTSGPGDAAPGKPSFTIFALAEVRGQIGPCGCTSDPLGDIARTTQLVADAGKDGTPVLVVDAGSLLYSQSPVPAHLIAQEDLKADLLANIYQHQLAVTAVGLGPSDLARGPDQLRFPRLAANVTGGYPTKPPEVATAGDHRIGVFGVIAEDAFKVSIADPVAAGKKAVHDLRAQGAQVVVALVQASTKKEAITLAKAIGGIDLAIAGLGQNAPEPDAVEIQPTPIDHGWLVIPGNRGQVVSRLDVYARGAPSPLADAIGSAAATAKIARLDKDLAARDAELARFAGDRSADPGFVAAKQRERAGVVAERAQLAKQPLVVPATGSYFTLDQVKIAKRLACSVATQDLVTAFYAAAGAANVKAAAGKAVEPAAKGKPGYVGSAACTDCHDGAAKFWQKTVHAQAWKTLVDRGQQFDYDCIGCHVTGWQQPGGSNLAHNEPLRDVQCETCHGPGSIHVAKGGEETPLAIVRDPPENLCASQCHTHEHSDTFQHDAYLRDIVGPGHGDKRRVQLGDGPTGASLRKAALDRAGKSLGAGCTR